ncbi:MAG: tRNA adenosine(34) deaminase TadA [Desulfobacca sp.]|uniref:tRNA adenosine(34) deaminase TadA n=1 Tax=Desulfobacca sp. TaxID=2067990 RepID=UPI00404A1FF4
MTDLEYMQEALAEAQQAWEAEEVPIGALVVNPAGEIIGRGHNRPIAAQDPTAHAEIIALRQAAAFLGNYRLPGCIMYVTIEPCIMCVGALLQARIKRLVYGAADAKGGAVASLYRLADDPRLNHRLEVLAGVAAVQCRQLLQDFFRRKRRLQHA